MAGRVSFTRRHLGKAALAGAALVTAPMPLGSVSAQAFASMKVALLLPTSGSQAAVGQACRRGADVANEVFADLGMPARLDIANHDTESDVDTGRLRATAAIDGGAHMLVGAVDSDQTIAIAEVAEQRRVPMIVNIAAAPRITERGHKFVVRNFPTTPMSITRALASQKQIFKLTGKTPRTAVLMGANDRFGSSMIHGISALFPKLDMPYEIVDTITYDPAARDLSAEIGRAKAAKADMMMPVCRLNDARLLVQEMVRQRWEPMAVMSPGGPGLAEPEFLKALGKHGDFMISNIPWLDPRSAMTQALDKRHAAKFPGELLDASGGFTFEAMLIAAHAWLAAKSTKPEALMQALRTLRIDRHVIIGGPIQFDAKGQNDNIKVAAVENLKRKPTVVMPLEAAAAPLVFPMPAWNDKRRG